MNRGTTSAINPHLLTGAHALGALPDAERDEFEAHLGRCPACTDEVAGLQETTARLGRAVVHVSPRALRPRVLGAVRLVRQAPPTSEITTFPTRRQGFRRAAALVAVACAAAAVVAGVHSASTTPTRTSPVTPPRTRVGDLLAAPDLRLATAGTPSGTVAMSHDRDEMVFLADDLPTLPARRAYQLWLVGDQDTRSAGLLRPAGSATSSLVSGIAGVREVILTVEPAGGSPGPTGAPVLTIVLR
ncbi:anti-sigma factor domain-containing protein [Lentzea sp. JNUCC 0626]|uniref:anti-sigma factor n=1 Tax=Lentzea sp. JNUCC 0626 TaxID=3367513 RepID=UPI00374A576C